MEGKIDIRLRTRKSYSKTSRIFKTKRKRWLDLVHSVSNDAATAHGTLHTNKVNGHTKQVETNL